MKTVAFLNIKGGVGKSASAITVSHILAKKYGKKVLIIDIDPQGNTSTTYSDLNVEAYFIRLLTGAEFEVDEYSVENLLLDRKLDIHKCIRHTSYENLDIIPSLLTLSEAEERLKADILEPQQFRLNNHLKSIQDEYDYCIIDCSPSISIVNINALATADVVYIPMKCDAWSGQGMCVAMKLIDNVSNYNQRLKLGGCFFTQWESNKNVSKTVQQLLEKYIPEKILPIKIRKSKLIEEISYTQTPLLKYDTQKGFSGVTKDYIKLTEYIMNN